MISTSNSIFLSAVEPTVQSKVQAFRFGSSPDFETCLTIQKTPLKNELFELKFETTFAKAKDPQGRQVKAQFFFSQNELIELSQHIQNAINDQTLHSDSPPASGAGL